MAPVSPESQRIARVYGQLRQALEAADWEAVAEADLAVRELLQSLPDEAELELASGQLRQRLQRLHAHGVKACAAECERLRQVLQRHIEYGEGRSAYLQTESLGGDGL